MSPCDRGLHCGCAVFSVKFITCSQHLVLNNQVEDVKTRGFDMFGHSGYVHLLLIQSADAIRLQPSVLYLHLKLTNNKGVNR